MINKAVIYASNYEETRDFYKQILPQTTIENESKSFDLSFEQNDLTFIKFEGQEAPFYHFAFLIPYEVFDEAKTYIASKVPLNTENGNDEISFAQGIRSFYFYDPAGNIVEFLSKENEILPYNDSFSEKSIYCLTEMSLVTNDIEKTVKELKNVGLDEAIGNVASGDLIFIFSDETVLLVSPVDREWIFSDKAAKVFPQEIWVDDIKIKIDHNENISIK